MTSVTRAGREVRRDVRYGPGAILIVPEVVRERGARRVLLVCGRRSFEASGAAKLLPGLSKVATVTEWREFAPNPDVADLRAGLAVAARCAPDLVLGVGGGSAMDLAKLLTAFHGLDPDDPAALAAAVATGAPAAPRALPLWLAPTTSGSGSEATRFAVVYIGDRKCSVEHESLLPDGVFLDPELSRSGSAYQRATSGIDAVTQAIESLWAVGATATSRRYARHALRLLLPAIERFVQDPGAPATSGADPDGPATPDAASALDAPARAMAIGSYLAGRAIDLSRTTAAHALSYGITKGYGVSHGHAVALTLGAFLAAHSDAGPERLRSGVDPSVHAAVMAEIRERLGASDGPAARERFRALLGRLGLDPSLTAAGAATPDQRAALAAAVDPQRLGNNPVAFTTAELTELLREVV